MPPREWMARGGLVFVFFFGGCSDVGGGFFHRLESGQTRMPPQSDGTRGFWFGGLFHTPGAWERHRFNGGAVAVCFEGLLREHVLAGGPASQPQPPVERQHEGLGGLGDSFAVGLGPLREHVLTTGERVKESPAGKTSLSKISSSFRTSFRDSGMKISGISAARRRIPPALRRRCWVCFGGCCGRGG